MNTRRFAAYFLSDPLYVGSPDSLRAAHTRPSRAARRARNPFLLMSALATSAFLMTACGGGDSGSSDPIAAAETPVTPVTPGTPSTPTTPTPPVAGGTLPAVSVATGDLSKATSKYASPIGSVDFLLTDGKTAYAFGSSASDTSYTRTVSTSTDGLNWSTRKAMAGPQDPSGDFAVNSKGVLAVHGCTYKAVNGFSVGVPYIRTSTDAVTWTERTLPALTDQEVSNLCNNGGGNIYAVGGAFAVVGQYCTALGSTDGSTWVMGSPSLNAGRTGVGNNCFLGFSTKGRLVIEHGTVQEFDRATSTSKYFLFYSVTTDGINWQQKRLFLNDKVAGSSAMAFLPSGEVRISTQVRFNDPVYGNSIGDPSTIWSTTDLSTWTPVKTDVKGQVPYILNFEAGAKVHPQIVEAPGFQYVCDGLHPLRTDINNLASSPDGLTFTTASLFAAGGDFADGKNKCRKLIYLTAANRLVGTVSTDANVTSFFTSN